MNPARGKEASETPKSHSSPTNRASRARPKGTSRNGTSREGTLARLLAALRAAREGDFSVRLRFDPEEDGGSNGFHRTYGKNGRTEERQKRACERPGRRRRPRGDARDCGRVQRHGRAERGAGERGGARRARRRPRGPDDRARRAARDERRLGRQRRIDQRADRRPGSADHRGRARHHRRRRGDLSQKMVLEIEGQPVKGEFLRIGTTVNVMVDQLSSFAAEVTRVAKEVGTEGKLGGQADVPGVAGTWKDLTDNVNGLAANLTAQVRNIAEVDHRGRQRRPLAEDHRRRARARCSSSRTPSTRWSISSAASPPRSRASRRRSAPKASSAARPTCRASPAPGRTSPTTSTSWPTNLTAQVRNIAEVTTAVANGDLSQKITVDAKGEILELKNTINTMVDQLNSFAAEVTRVAKEVGTEGKLGGQADVKGVSRHLEGPHRQRQLHGLEPDHAGARHRQGRDRGRQRRPVAEDRPSRRRARSPRSTTRSTTWPITLGIFAAAGHPRRAARSAPKASSARRPRCRASPAPGRT